MPYIHQLHVDACKACMYACNACKVLTHWATGFSCFSCPWYHIISWGVILSVFKATGVAKRNDNPGFLMATAA